MNQSTNSAILIDPGSEPERLLHEISSMKCKLLAILCTHGHIDHIGGVSEIKTNTSVPFYIHKGDENLVKSSAEYSKYFGLPPSKEPQIDEFLTSQNNLTFGEIDIKVIETPGHTPGGVCFLIDKYLFTGDTLFKSSIGRTDLPGGNYEQIIDSITNKLMTLDDDLIVYPGHGPDSSIGHERKLNPFIK